MMNFYDGRYYVNGVVKSIESVERWRQRNATNLGTRSESVLVQAIRMHKTLIALEAKWMSTLDIYVVSWRAMFMVFFADRGRMQRVS